MGETLFIYYNDFIDSDNLAAAMALWKATHKRPDTRLIWIIEPRQVCFGLSMTAKQVSRCQHLIQEHFPSLGNPFKVLLGGLIEQVDLDNIKGLTKADRHLLKMAAKPEYGAKDDAVLHGRLTAWDFASCLAEWSNNDSNEVFVDFETLDEIQNPVNLNAHHHEELVNRSADELKAYDKILKEPFSQPGWRSIPFPSTQPLVEWMGVHVGPPWMEWMEMDAKSGPVEWMDVEKWKCVDAIKGQYT
ncbi:hypothetical protein FPOAC2_04043 [Fusarium poae]